jgi:hypothetical protein
MKSYSTPILSFLAPLIAIVLCSGPAHAQQNNEKIEKAQTTEALREKAFNLLESLTGQLDGLQSAENRARLGSNIAESLWNHDEKRARSLLVAVENDIKAGLQQSGEGDEPTYEPNFMMFLRLRMDTVERIAKHDAELALAFLQATEITPDQELRYDVAESERALELRLANEIAAANPDIALKLGRQSLSRGFSADLVPLLKQLNKKHKEQALLLYKEIISKFSSTTLSDDWEAILFAQSLAGSFRPPAADESTFRELINIFITSVLASGCGKKVAPQEMVEFCRRMAPLIPEMQRVDPLRTASLKQWAPDFQESSSVVEAYEELREINHNGTVDEILALVPKYPQIAADIHWQAMTKAQSAGDADRARKIATDFTGDPEARERMLDQIEHDQMWAAMNNENLAEVQRILGTIPRPPKRLYFLMSIANRIGANDREAALKLLNQASGIVDTMKPGSEQTEAQLGLAMMYCFEKSDRGLAIMESLVPKLNNLVDAAARLDGFDTSYLREGEWNMSAEGGIGRLLTALARNAGYFGWCDFDRALSLAAQFERPEIRLMAQLKLAQGILAGPPKRLPLTNSPLN